MKLTFTLNRGRHYVQCVRCGKLFSQPIADQAELEYRYNPANPYLGLCYDCDGHRGVSEIRLRSNLSYVKALDEDKTPLDYSKLEGDWAFYYKVAYRYSKKVVYQDRQDLCHDLILTLAKQRAKDGKPLPELRAYRIASLTVALHWRELNRKEQKVCLYSGVPKEPNCKACKHKADTPCAYRAIRPILSLDSEVESDDGYISKLSDFVADDRSPDLAELIDTKVALLGCPLRLYEIIFKKDSHKKLTKTEKQYLWRFRKKRQRKLPLYVDF